MDFFKKRRNRRGNSPFKEMATYLGIAVFAAFSLTYAPQIGNAFFWEREAPMTAEQQIVAQEAVTQAAAESFKVALLQELSEKKDLIQEEAAAYYNANDLTESTELATKFTDRTGDIERLEQLDGRDIVSLLQWAMFERSKQSAGELGK